MLSNRSLIGCLYASMCCVVSVTDRCINMGDCCLWLPNIFVYYYYLLYLLIKISAKQLLEFCVFRAYSGFVPILLSVALDFG